MIVKTSHKIFVVLLVLLAALILAASTALAQADVKMNALTASPTLVHTNENFTYTTSVTNLGPQSAHATVTFTLPAGTTLVSSTNDGWWTCNGTTCTVVNPIGPGGSSNPVRFTVKASAEGTITGGSASVTVTEIDPNTANNSTTSTSSVTVTDHADMKMNTPTVSPTVVSVGQNFTYETTVTNLGPQFAHATVTFTLPTGTTFVSSTNDGWWTCNGTTCTVVNPIGPGGSSNPVRFTVKAATARCSYSTTVRVSATEIDSNLSNNSATTPTVTVSPCDSTPPVVNVNFTPNGQNGWFITSPATGTVTAADAFPSNVTAINCTGATLSGLTGIGTKNASGTLTVSAQGTSNISCTATDSIGNSGAAAGSSNTKTVKIDSVAPSVIITPDRAPDQNGIYNHAVLFTFTGTDSTSDAVVCSAAATYSGPDNVSASVSGSCTDNAGNTGTASFSFSFDATGPIITGSRTPAANANGWNNTDVTVSFTCTDASSDVDSVTGPTTLSSEGAGQSATGTCTDKAGNTASATVGGINIDKTDPVITGSRMPPANSFGWNNTTITVSFSCDDALSGVFTEPASPQLFSGQGAGQSASATCIDKAGNSASATLGDINIDLTAPIITDLQPSPGSFINNNQPEISAVVTDELSGIDPASVILIVDGQVVAHTFTPLQLGPGSAVLSARISFVPAPLDDGLHNVSLTVSDRAGTPGVIAAPAITVDTQPPQVGTSPPVVNTGSVEFTVVGAVSGSACYTGPVSDCFSITSGTVAIPGTLPDGDYSITVTATDQAGNTTTVTWTFTVDTKAPATTAIASPDPNSNGWNNADVLVTLSAVDTPGSGVKEIHFSLSGAQVGGSTELGSAALASISAEGATTITYFATDNAGNQEATKTLAIHIDKTLPTITGSRTPDPNANGWNNTDVVASFSCAETGSVQSGIDTDTVAGATVSSEGAGQSVTNTGTCIDKAGNAADSATVSDINVDKTKSVITGSRTPAANANGWNNTDVTVSFSCADTGTVQSGIDTDTVAGATLSSEGAVQSVTSSGICRDKAGNDADPVTVGDINIDKTDPIITGSRTPAANANGWNNTDVTVSFTCGDALSGVESCVGGTTLSGEGAAQSATGTATDQAGNSASTTINDINIDKTAPTIAISAPANGGAYMRNAAVASSYSCGDALAGVASCSGPVPSGGNFDTSTVGVHVFTVNAADLAGNMASLTNTYTVTAAYNFIGFLPPLSSAAFSGVFRLGSTIPIKWQLTDANGAFISSLSVIASLKIDSVACDGSADNTPPFDPGSSGNTGLRYDTSANQYIFNWQTKGLAAGCFNIVLKLNDNTIHSTRVQLRN